jgi:hypothetical protein
MNFVYKFILHTIKNVTNWKKNLNTEMQGFKIGSPIRLHVKMGPLVTHPARVADSWRFQFSVRFGSQRLWEERVP